MWDINISLHDKSVEAMMMMMMMEAKDHLFALGE